MMTKATSMTEDERTKLGREYWAETVKWAREVYIEEFYRQMTDCVLNYRHSDQAPAASVKGEAPVRERAMSEDHISVLCIPVFVVNDQTPWQLMKPLEPTNAINRAWIPRSMGDDVVAAYEFATPEQKAAWEESLPGNVVCYIRPHLLSVVRQHGWGSNDYNGFPAR